jgi:hypothetical protein
MQIIRAEYVALTGDILSAMLLNYFEQWQASVGTGAWFYRTQEQIFTDLFNAFTISKIRRATTRLISLGFMVRRKHSNRQIRTWQYQFCVSVVQNELTKLQNNVLNASKPHFESAENAHYNRIEETEKTIGEEQEPLQDGFDVVKLNLPTWENASVKKLTTAGVKNASQWKDIPAEEITRVIDASKGKRNPPNWIVSALKNRWYAQKAAPSVALQEPQEPQPYDAYDHVEISIVKPTPKPQPVVGSTQWAFTGVCQQVKLRTPNLYAYLTDAEAIATDGNYTVTVSNQIKCTQLNRSHAYIFALLKQIDSTAKSIQFTCEDVNNDHHPLSA